MAESSGTPSKKVRLPEELREAVERHCQAHKVSFSDFAREALAAALDEPDLAEPLKLGRPKKNETKRPKKKQGRRR
jgi:Arc/MetJ-type ribon-helix-helix transcriptional regulator